MSEIKAPTENRKLFSIIIATHNCGEKIVNTLHSIFSQNRELFEVIIFDNASTDDTLLHIKQFENDVILRSEKDDGIYFAFNKAIDIANGDFLYFIGAGDTLKPDILEKVAISLPCNGEPTFAYGRCYFVKQKVENGKEFFSKLFIRDNLCQQGIFYHHKIFGMVGKFDLRYKILSDWVFNLKCFLDERIAKNYLDLVIADYEEGGLSADTSRDPLFLEEFPQFVKKQFGTYSYFLCRAFFKKPYLFNYIYNWHFLHRPAKFANRNKVSRSFIRLLKS